MSLVLFLSGCGGLTRLPQLDVATRSTFAPTWTFRPLPAPTETATVTPTVIPADTFTASPIPAASPTETWISTPEPKFLVQGPGRILAPIFLYHQVGHSKINDNPYYVSPEQFEQQMVLLHAWGYQTITVSQLADAILNGAQLPAKPILLTFDDGNENTYTTVLPILQKSSFVGTAYVVYKFIGAAGFMNKDQLRTLYEAGWEIGSHGLSHVDLTRDPDQQEAEIVGSRRKLEETLAIPVSTFAYPFGAYDDLALDFIHRAGYVAAVGLGADEWQGPNNIFYLYRRPIKGTDDLKTFAGFLPWQGDMNSLPAFTLVP